MEQQAVRDDLDIPAPTYRVPAKRGILDMDTRRLALVAGFFACGIALVVSVWTALSSRGGGPVPVVAADGRPLKVRPENPGGMQTTGQNEDILGTGRGGAGQLAPGPEAPAPQALRQRQMAEETARQEAARQEAARQEAARQAALAPQAQPVALPQNPPAALTMPSVTAPGRAAGANPTATAPAPGAAAPSAAPRQGATPAATPHATPAGGGGKAVVQLAAVGTEQAAKQEWQRLTKKMPDVLGGHQPLVTKTERDGKTYYRLRTGGFADQTQATAFCDRVKAKGASCSVSPS
jgi:hypothetical protein